MDRKWKIRTIIGLVCICIDLVFFMSTMFVRRK